MLLELEVQNLAVIERLHLALTPGLNILTGETGAGKSILIDALGLVLGQRANLDLIRTGTKQARVAALFQIWDKSELHNLLAELDVELAEDGQLLLTREITVNGKNVCRINGKLATVGMLRSIGELLVDIHGQHDHQSLWKPENHIDFLDNYGGEELIILRQFVGEKYRLFRSLQKKMQELESSARERAQKMDLYSFQAREIAAAALQQGEEEELLSQKEILLHGEKLFQLTQAAYQVLYGDDEAKAVIENLQQVLAWLQQAASLDARLQSLVDNLTSLYYQLDDIAHELRSYRDNLELNPARLEEVEDRLHIIAELKRKYGENISEILQYGNWVQGEIEKLIHTDEARSALKEQIAAVEKELISAAHDLSVKRKTLGQAFAQNVKAELVQLGMTKTQFFVSISQREEEAGLSLDTKKPAIGPKGFDQVEFLLAPNPGETPKPLARIASGGELSRVMLGLKTVLADIDAVPTLIFDEIDAGIGGRAAQAVAEKLSRLSTKRQVLCITHLPQIASMADSHWKITKETVNNRTFTIVSALDLAGRVDELARMLGGAEVTATTKKHALEMLKLASKTQN
ncbi:MAG: DNA repair protein RecN [bacterium]|jgi:DNA repair protein RecN (Recombination protein N)